MKKGIACLLLAALILGLCSCGVTSSNSSKTSSKTEITKATKNKTYPDIKDEMDVDGDGLSEYPEIFIVSVCDDYSIYENKIVISTIRIDKIKNDKFFMYRYNYGGYSKVEIQVDNIQSVKAEVGNYITFKGFLSAYEIDDDIYIRVQPYKFLEARDFMFYDFGDKKP